MGTKINVNGVETIIKRKSVKNIYLKICLLDGKIQVSAPFRMKLGEIKKFVLSKLNWIKKKQENFNKKSLKYLSNEIHYFRGEKYTLKLVKHKSEYVKLEEKNILLHAPGDSPIQKKELIMKKWYRDELTKFIAPLIKKWEHTLNVSVEKFFIRSMKTRWGSCTPKSRCLRFNLDLAKTSPEILEYVVIHELIHLIEASHNKRFKTLMKNYCPNWKNLRKELNNLDNIQ
tara:strand:+ start:26 stop:712 length:687 start_codon:yes stop_codon:yes gene_type:complete